jgi:hypothetical protein
LREFFDELLLHHEHSKHDAQSHAQHEHAGEDEIVSGVGAGGSGDPRHEQRAKGDARRNDSP